MSETKETNQDLLKMNKDAVAESHLIKKEVAVKKKRQKKK